MGNREDMHVILETKLSIRHKVVSARVEYTLYIYKTRNALSQQCAPRVKGPDIRYTQHPRNFVSFSSRSLPISPPWHRFPRLRQQLLHSKEGEHIATLIISDKYVGHTYGLFVAHSSLAEYARCCCSRAVYTISIIGWHAR